jgi:hypothetical protein
MARQSEHWSREEVEATVADYMHMLTLELSGQRYNKSAHRRALISKLTARTDGAIELKHQNTSAVLRDLGCHWISGYKPRSNYQGILFEIVADWIKQHPEFDRVSIAAAEQPAITPLQMDYSVCWVEAPSRPASSTGRVVEEPAAKYAFQNPVCGHRDYVAREARNASLGLAGEELVVAYERDRLIKLGKSDLADRVEHISQSRGDGAGFDILSFEPSGAERFIEVKTTAFGKYTPFFASINEVEFARAFEAQFQLYRVFEFRREPRLFCLPGRLEHHCQLDAISFRCQL